jgi:basic amino acid/polyamine antiporter, APA family
VSFVYPWQDLVANHLGTEAAFARAFGSTGIARLILVAAFLSLFKVMNGNFVAATRMLYALGRRGLVQPALGAVHPRFGTPSGAIVLMAVLTGAGALLGDALLVPVTEVGSLAVGIGWCVACVAFLRRAGGHGQGRALALAGATVGLAIVLMKTVPAVPGSFTATEWLVFAAWCALGLMFWSRRDAPLPPAAGARAGSG